MQKRRFNLDSFRRFSGRLVPTIIATLIYRIIAFISLQIFFCFFKDVKIWIRNSAVLGTVSFLASDIDLTLLIDNKNFSHKIQLRKSLQILKKWIPLFADFNIYFQTDFKFLNQHFNTYELARDPFLLARFKKTNNRQDRSPDELKVEAFVYIIRMIAFDLQGIVEHPQVRKKKWKSYLTLCKVSPVTQVSLSSLLQKASQILELSVCDEEKIACLFQAIALDSESFKTHKCLDALKASPDWGLCLFPQQYCYTDLSLVPLTKTQQLIQQKQVQWEIVGLLSQQFLFNDKESLPRHLENILKAIPSSQIQLRLNVADGIRLLHEIT